MSEKMGFQVAFLSKCFLAQVTWIWFSASVYTGMNLKSRWSDKGSAAKVTDILLPPPCCCCYRIQTWKLKKIFENPHLSDPDMLGFENSINPDQAQRF